MKIRNKCMHFHFSQQNKHGHATQTNAEHSVHVIKQNGDGKKSVQRRKSRLRTGQGIMPNTVRESRGFIIFEIEWEPCCNIWI